MKVKSALTCKIYQKALMLSNKSKHQKTTGEIVNLMSVDTQKIGDALILWHMGVCGLSCIDLFVC
jgi:hypothetical protein